MAIFTFFKIFKSTFRKSVCSCSSIFLLFLSFYILISLPEILTSYKPKSSSVKSSFLGLYILTVVVKQILEPKLVSNKIGIHPIFTLIAMYTGFKLIGVLGLLLGPIILVVLKNIFSASIDKGIIKAILE